VSLERFTSWATQTCWFISRERPFDRQTHTYSFMHARTYTKKTLARAGGVAQWWSMCLAPPHPPKKRKKERKEKNIISDSSWGDRSEHTSAAFLTGRNLTLAKVRQRLARLAPGCQAWPASSHLSG
jgi:hypothetical protein